MTYEDILNEVGSTYDYLYQQRYGRTSYMSTQKATALQKAATICMEIGANPRAFVEAQFKFANVKDIYPTILYGANCKKYYTQFTERTHVDLDKQWEVQCTYLKDGLSAGRVLETLLLDDILDFKSWFRIVITKEELPEVIARYKEKAQSELTAKLEDFLLKKSLPVERIKRED